MSARRKRPATSLGRDGQRGQAMLELALVAPIMFALLLGVFEAARLIFHYELLQDAARDGARYAIVHGSRSTCPSGPPPPGETNACDPTGANVKAAVEEAALGIVEVGDLFVHDPVWTSRGSLSTPMPGDASSGNNARGEYVTVFVDFTYETIIGDLLGGEFIPPIEISAETTLVINN